MNAAPVTFLHIPKTGGTSLLRVMERVYGEVCEVPANKEGAFCLIDGYERYNAWHGHMPFGLHAFLKRADDAVCYCGELVARHTEASNHTAMAMDPPFVPYITIVRDPALRAISQFREHRRHVEGGLRPIHLVKPYLTMTAFFSGTAYIEHIVPTKVELELALHNIRNHFAYVGRTSRLDDIPQYMQGAYGWPACSAMPWLRPGDISIEVSCADREELRITPLLELDRLLYREILRRGPRPSQW